MFKIGDRVEIVGGHFARYKVTITRVYEKEGRVMVTLDTDSLGESITVVNPFWEKQIIKVN
jgi:transcription antitermination factor NusG